MKYKLVDEFGLHRGFAKSLPEAMRVCREHGWQIRW